MLVPLLPLIALAQGCGKNPSMPAMPPTRAELLAELDPRLRSMKAVPDEENAWILWQKTGRESIPPKRLSDRLKELQKKPELTPSDGEEIFTMEKRIAPMAQAIARGLTMPYCQPPFVPGAEVRFPELLAWKYVTGVKTLAMRGDAEMGRDKDALDRLSLVLRFCQRLRDGKPILIPYLVAIAIETECMAEVLRLLRRGFLASRAAQIARLIEETAGEPSGYQDSIGSDVAQPTIGILLGIDETETNESLRTSTLPLGAESMLPGLKVGELGRILGRHEKPYDIRQTARDLNAAVRPLMSQDPLVYRPIEGDLAPWEQWLARWPKAVIEGGGTPATDSEIDEARSALANETNPFGRLVAGQLLLIYPHCVAADFSRRTHREGTRLIARWIADGKKSFPESKDPFSGKPLRVDPARGIYWSVGHNGVDDHGTGVQGGADKDQPDIVFGLPTGGARS
ncbi:MAG: hypothetical protein HONBIEJF_00572 [Fimbriimonadaceae bacterium]|nr:hypothetical protein [Fimbriimonadaceae bacterium]